MSMRRTHRRWTSRKFLLAIVGQIVGLLVLIFPEHDQVITEAAASIAGVLLMAGTAMGFIWAEGKADEVGARARVEQEFAETQLRELVRQQQNQVQQLRHQLSSSGAAPVAGLLLACLLLLGAAGCQQWQQADPVQKYAALQDTYIEVLRDLTGARQLGLIDLDDWNAYYLPLINEGDELLDAIGDAAKEGRDVEVEVFTQSLRDVLRKLILKRQELESQGATHGPETRFPAGAGGAGRDRPADPQLQKPLGAGAARAAGGAGSAAQAVRATGQRPWRRRAA